MKKQKSSRKSPEKDQKVPRPLLWLKAVYHFHVFHYRMPHTAAIAAVTPFVPSPLTVKMAMIASLLQRGEAQKAEQLAPYLPQIQVRVQPPLAAFSFKAFMRYRSVPAIESPVGLDESGSFYPSRPHTREYALFADDLVVYVGLPNSQMLSNVEEALRNIRYLGCKDSQVWCRYIQQVEENIVTQAHCLTHLSERQPGSVVLLADFLPDVQPALKDLIPGNRKKGHYPDPPPPYVLPGRIITHGRTRLFIRRNT